MKPIIFKRLFEVRILHDYYLMKSFSDTSTDSFFDQSDANQLLILQDVLTTGKYDVSKLFQITPLPATMAAFRRYSMRFIPTPLGFFMGIEVRRVKTENDDGSSTVTYRPFIPFSQNVDFHFLLNSLDPSLFQVAQLPVSTALKSKYLFTNRDLADTKDFPALSEAASGGAVNVTDLKLLPFNITVLTEIGKSYELEFKDPGDTVLLTKNRVANSERISISLGFADNSTLPFQEGEYQLEILEDGGTLVEDTFYFSNQSYRESNFGLLNFSLKSGSPSEPAFDLIDADGFLQARIQIASDATETIVPHPTYELRIIGDFS